jgi:hypothetical protein
LNRGEKVLATAILRYGDELFMKAKKQSPASPPFGNAEKFAAGRIPLIWRI